MSELLDSVLLADPVWVVLVLVAYMIHFWLKAVRWCDLLEPVYRARTAEAFPVMMTGFFANNFLPAHLGEFVTLGVPQDRAIHRPRPSRRIFDPN